MGRAASANAAPPAVSAEYSGLTSGKLNASLLTRDSALHCTGDVQDSREGTAISCEIDASWAEFVALARSVESGPLHAARWNYTWRRASSPNRSSPAHMRSQTGRR